MENRNISQSVKWITGTLVLSAIFFSSCQKEVNKQGQTAAPEAKSIALPKTSNPYSLKNISKAQGVIAASAAKHGTVQMRTDLNTLPKYVYFKFDPEQLSAELFQALESDSTVQLLDIPFADAALYNESFALDEAKAQLLKDGFIYGVTDINNINSLPLLQRENTLSKQFIDTLALIPEEDTTLQYEAYRQAGATEDQINALRICLFKRPSGNVRYWDDEYGRLEPVRGMQVWGLVFGIPLHTYTDGNGYYSFPWRFSAGTIMGTHAKNDRVTIKPFNTVGGWVLTSLIQAFVVGSVHIKGWVSACDMRNEVNFDFYDHSQVKYWSQLLNAYYFHDQYAAQDRIYNAPGHMICYAHWANKDDIGAASTPMLYHLTGADYTDQFIQQVFGNPVTGTLLRLIHGLLPDMTFKVCGKTAPDYYNVRLAQTAFHELGHASMYRKVGAGWYIALMWAELTHNCTSGNPYCDGTYSGAGHVAVAESWSEFIGSNYGIRRYPNGFMKATHLTGTYRMRYLIEYESWFHGSTWIPYGVYNDLMDTYNSSEGWDNINGATMSQLYNAFGSDVATMCGYEWRFMQNNPQFNVNDIDLIFTNHQVYCK